MIPRSKWFATLALVLASLHGHPALAQGQSPPRSTSAAADSQEAARRQILDGDRWRRTFRALNEWLSVQQVYTPEQVAKIRAELTDKVARSGPRELEDLLKDMEDRLEVLLSPEGEDARQWLAQFLAVARNPEQQLGRSRPDVLNMTASQIRQELQWLQQHRAARQQSHAAFNQGRALQVQSARNTQNAARQSRAPAAPNRSAATHAQFRSQYSPQPQDRPNHSDLQPKPFAPPVYTVSPWGAPVYWNPLSNTW